MLTNEVNNDTPWWKQIAQQKKQKHTDTKENNNTEIRNIQKKNSNRQPEYKNKNSSSNDSTGAHKIWK